jgi:hypothetical protein
MATPNQPGGQDAQFSAAKEAVDLALASDRLPSCALDEAGLQAQQARHARLAPSLISFERRGESVHFRFSEGCDRQALEEMVAVEQECCPFFDFAFDRARRELRVGVTEKEMLPALDAIASHLGATG